MKRGKVEFQSTHRNVSTADISAQQARSNGKTALLLLRASSFARMDILQYVYLVLDSILSKLPRLTWKEKYSAPHEQLACS